MAVTTVTAVYSADTSSFVRGTKAAQAAAQQFSNAMGQADSSAGRTKASTIALGSAMGMLGAQAFAQASSRIKAFAMQGIQAAASFEQTVISIEGIFVGMGMSVGEATTQTKTYLADLRDFAATTPFELPQTLDAVKRLLSIGYAAEDVKDRLLPAIGDITSALGQPASSINAVVYAMGQIKSAGRVMQQDLMQIGNALPGFNARMAIAKELFNGDMNAMAEAVESGSLSGEKAIEALISQMQKFPGAAGAMERQSKTLNGVISTFKDTVNNALIDALMPTMPVLSEALTNLVDPVSQLAVAFANQLGPILVSVATNASNFAPQLAELAAAIMDLAGGSAQRLITVLGELAPALTLMAKAVGVVADFFGMLPSPILAATAALIILMRTGIGKAFIGALTTGSMSVIRFGTTFKATAATATGSMRSIAVTSIASMRATDASFKAASASIQSFKATLASSGIGLLIVGISTALAAMAFSSDEASTAAADFTETLMDQNGVLVENHRQLVAKELQEKGILDAARRAGVATDQLVSAYIEGGAALEPYVAQMEAYSKAATQGYSAGRHYTQTTEEGALAVGTAADMLREYGTQLDVARANIESERVAVLGVNGALAANAATTGEVSMATLRAAQAADLYSTSAAAAATATQGVEDAAAAAAAELAAMREENEAWTKSVSAMSAVDSAAAAIEKIGTSAVENGAKLVGTTPKIRAFRGDVIAAFEQSARSAAALGRNTEEQRQIFTGELVKIVAALRASKVKDSDIQTFLGAMDNLPASVEQIMIAAGVAVGKGGKKFKSDVQQTVEKAYKEAAKAGAPMTADAMAHLAQTATDKAKAKMGLTLEPELTAVLNAASSGLQTTAKNAGNPVGYNMSTGIAAGIDEGSPIVIAAVERVIAAAKAAADAASKSKSPSRVFAEVGDNLIMGLRLGWTRGSKPFVDDVARTLQDAYWATKDAAQRIADAKKALQDVREEKDKGEATSKDVKAAEQALAQAYRDQYDAANALREAQKNLNATRKLQKMAPLKVDWKGLLSEFNKTGDVSKIWDSLSDSLYARARRAGMTRTAAAAYVDSVLNAVQDQVDVRLRRLERLRERLASVQDSIQQLQEKIAQNAEARTAAASDIALLLRQQFGQPGEFDKAYRAADLTIDGAIDLFNRLEELVKRRFTGVDPSADDAIISRLQARTQTIIDLIAKRNAAADALQKAKDDLKAVEDARVATESKLADSLLSFSKISGKISSADEYVAGLKQRVAATKDYVANIAALRKRGVSESVIQQILDAGVESGGAFAAALTGATDAQLKEINTLTTQSQTIAEAFGTDQATIMYGAAVTAQKKLVEGYQTEYDTVVKAIQAEVDAIRAEMAPLGDAGYNAGVDLAQSTLAGLQSQEAAILAEIARIGAEIQAAWAKATAPVQPPPAPGGGNGGRDGGGGGRRRRSSFTPAPPPAPLPYSSVSPAIAVAADAIKIQVTVGPDQSPAVVQEAAKSAVMEALSEVAARAASARR